MPSLPPALVIVVFLTAGFAGCAGLPEDLDGSPASDAKSGSPTTNFETTLTAQGGNVKSTSFKLAEASYLVQFTGDDVGPTKVCLIGPDEDVSDIDWDMMIPFPCEVDAFNFCMGGKCSDINQNLRRYFSAGTYKVAIYCGTEPAIPCPVHVEVNSESTSTSASSSKRSSTATTGTGNIAASSTSSTTMPPATATPSSLVADHEVQAGKTEVHDFMAAQTFGLAPTGSTFGELYLEVVGGTYADWCLFDGRSDDKFQDGAQVTCQGGSGQLKATSGPYLKTVAVDPVRHILSVKCAPAEECALAIRLGARQAQATTAAPVSPAGIPSIGTFAKGTATVAGTHVEAFPVDASSLFSSRMQRLSDFGVKACLIEEQFATRAQAGQAFPCLTHLSVGPNGDYGNGAASSTTLIPAWYAIAYTCQSGSACNIYRYVWIGASWPTPAASNPGGLEEAARPSMNHYNVTVGEAPKAVAFLAPSTASLTFKVDLYDEVRDDAVLVTIINAEDAARLAAGLPVKEHWSMTLRNYGTYNSDVSETGSYSFNPGWYAVVFKPVASKEADPLHVSVQFM